MGWEVLFIGSFPALLYLDENGEAIREAYVPQVGETIDRYGPETGRFTCPVTDGKTVSYDARSLPYVEDPAQYHQYEVVGDFADLETYVKNCGDEALKTQIDKYVKTWYGSYEEITGYKGTIAPVEGWGSGGGTQYQLPLSVDWLLEIGILKEVK